MMYRKFGRVGTPVAEVGFGTWGMGGWSGSDDEASKAALRRGLELGCNFFDTAWAYGNGHSETLLGEVLAGWSGAAPFIATKIPPKNGQWPARADYPLDDVFPADHIRVVDRAEPRRTSASRASTCSSSTSGPTRGPTTSGGSGPCRDLKREGLIKAVGISVNRWEPANVLGALRTGLIDAVQVVYNIFDQAPEDELFPLCQELGVAVIARVPFDEGSLTGTMTVERHVAEGRLAESLLHAARTCGRRSRAWSASRPTCRRGWTCPTWPCGSSSHHPAVTTIIPGMRTVRHVERNLAVSRRQPLPRQPVGGDEGAPVGQDDGDSVGARG